MRLLQTTVIHGGDPTVTGPVWQIVQQELATAIAAVVWPPHHANFTIRPEPHGNGVVLIKKAFFDTLHDVYSWRTQHAVLPHTGSVDAIRDTPAGPFAVEWETGNISSSHRSLNRLAIGMLNGVVAGGILVLPSRALYAYLTDRIGNFQEIAPYFPVYKALPLANYVLAVMEIEHDAIDIAVPLIPKGTDGRALR